MGVCNCSMYCCTFLYVHSSIAIILMGKRELIALLNLSSWCLVMVEQLFLTVPRGCLQFVIVVFPDHTHLLFLVSLVTSCTRPLKQCFVGIRPPDVFFLRRCCSASTNVEWASQLVFSWVLKPPTNKTLGVIPMPISSTCSLKD